jgi:pseudaminic acid biosynthesis-associated methylase
MSSENNFSTEQEKFWAGEFGNNYINRNKGDQLLASNLNFFTRSLRTADTFQNCIEFGANIGMNLKALSLLYPNVDLYGIEINPHAANELADIIPKKNIFLESILNFSSANQWDLVLIKGVLIHINPNSLQLVYQKLFDATRRYLLICEYYNPSPVSIQYRGHTDKLFKRDFAGEVLDQFSCLKLVDYGFAYRRDPTFPQDDITWFLLEKRP